MIISAKNQKQKVLNKYNNEQSHWMNGFWVFFLATTLRMFVKFQVSFENIVWMYNNIFYTIHTDKDEDKEEEVEKTKWFSFYVK